MTVSYVLTDVDLGSQLVGVHEGLPPGVSPADSELGWSQSLERLVRLVERED